MSEAKAKRRAHAAVLAANPYCIYCGDRATTVEHMPPMILFRGRRRPKGMEFSACAGCNHGTKLSDQVAALMARLSGNDRVDPEGSEVRALLRAVSNNAPGLLQEMQLGRGAQKIARRSIPNVSADSGILRASGPLLGKHMGVFAAKLGFAVHYENFGSPVPRQGAVQPMWFTNVQAARGQLPYELIRLLPPSRSLKQGIVEVGDQFAYTSARTDEARHSFVYAVFGSSFAVAAITALDKMEFLSKSADQWPLVLRGDFKST